MIGGTFPYLKHQTDGQCNDPIILEKFSHLNISRFRKFVLEVLFHPINFFTLLKYTEVPESQRVTWPVGTLPSGTRILKLSENQSIAQPRPITVGHPHTLLLESQGFARHSGSDPWATLDCFLEFVFFNQKLCEPHVRAKWLFLSGQAFLVSHFYFPDTLN